MELYYTVWQPLADRREEAAAQKKAAQRLLRQALLRRGQRLDTLREFRTPEGRPGFYGLPFDFNLSHTAGMAACAVGGQVGVDCEAPREYRPAVARRVCAPEELEALARCETPSAEFLRLWTLKEAFVKLVGTGLSYGLNRVTEAHMRARYPNLIIYTALVNGLRITAMDAAGGEVLLVEGNPLS